MKKHAVSSGGVVASKIDGAVCVLLIRDINYLDWVLPKGHVEEGESLEEAALREVNEEAGLTHVKVISLLGKYERYVERAQEQKTIYYYLMHQTDSEETESIEGFEVRWFEINHLPSLYIPEQKDLLIKAKETITISLS